MPELVDIKAASAAAEETHIDAATAAEEHRADVAAAEPVVIPTAASKPQSSAASVLLMQAGQTAPALEPQNARMEIIPAEHRPKYPNLASALAAAQASFVPVPKNKTARVKSQRTGAEYEYKYADLADILNMALPRIAACGLAIMQPIRRIGNGMFLVTEIHHESGEVFADDGIPLALGGGPQEFGSQLTYMRRYGSCSILGIAPDTDEDGALAQDASKGKGKQQGQQQREMPEAPYPHISGEQVKQWNLECQRSGLDFEARGKWLRDHGWDFVAHIPIESWEEAVRWASSGPKAAQQKPAGAPQDAGKGGGKGKAAPKGGKAPQGSGKDDGKPLDDGKSTARPGYIDGAQKRAFWDAARKHHPDADITAYLKHTLKIESTADMKVEDYTAALEWATKADQPEMTVDEKRAREAFGILGLDLLRQSEAIAAWTKDGSTNWAGLADAASAEIDKGEAAE